MTGVARSTIGRGLAELRSEAATVSRRIRRPGGGRKPKVETEPGLLEMLNFLGIERSRDQVRKAIENNSLRAMREKEEKAKNSGAALGKGTLLRKHNLDREDGRFVRSGSVGGWREKLSQEQNEMVTRYAGDDLLRAGYPAGLHDEAQAELAGEVRR